jgi:hypothetical protein
MMADYLLRDGTAVTIDQIREAFNTGKAVLVHNHADGHSATGLMLDGEEFDTRDECYSVWDECWTTAPKSINQCCFYSRC